MDFYIFGAGGFAKEVYVLFDQRLDQAIPLTFRGFVERNVHIDTIGIGAQTFPVHSENWFDQKVEKEMVAAAIGVGHPDVLEKLAKKYSGRVTFPNLIHRSAGGHFASIKMGEGNLITAGCQLTCCIEIGSFNIVNLNCTVGHDCQIGSYNVFNPGVNISGGMHVGNGCLVGTNATLLQNLRIEDKVTIGAAALLTRNAVSGKTYVGVPAKPREV
jgi:sugar O-acyltransferase (sialic acid O-acetyltransferase NeuD family)